MRATALLIVALWLSGLALRASKYDDAVELYKEGPSKGPEIIRLLREHLAKEPKDEKALRLLGITQFGIGDSEGALATFNRVIDLIEKDDRISPQVVMYKARALFDLDRKPECKKILGAYWAFWQDDEKLKGVYEWYWDRVKDEPDPTPPDGEEDGATEPKPAAESKTEAVEEANP
jgi:tetratricopeptide (TPR) repeat protein